jgi:hypothetical protein
MADAGTHDILDAEGHRMELHGFLDPFIDSSVRGRVRRRSDRSRGAEGEERLLRDEDWRPLGACDPGTRRRVRDLLRAVRATG